MLWFWLTEQDSTELRLIQFVSIVEHGIQATSGVLLLLGELRGLRLIHVRGRAGKIYWKDDGVRAVRALPIHPVPLIRGCC
jgi:hypothetical protein